GSKLIWTKAVDARPGAGDADVHEVGHPDSQVLGLHAVDLQRDREGALGDGGSGGRNQPPEAHGGQQRHELARPVAHHAPHQLADQPEQSAHAYASRSALSRSAGAMSGVRTPSCAMLTVPRSSLTARTSA